MILPQTDVAHNTFPGIPYLRKIEHHLNTTDIMNRKKYKHNATTHISYITEKKQKMAKKRNTTA